MKNEKTSPQGKTKLARFVLRLPTALKASLEKDAERQGRSLNGYIVHILKRANSWLDFAK